MLRKMLQRKCWIYILMLCGGMFFFTRLIYLDSDLPPLGVAWYQPMDEGCYAQLALNYIKYGAINPGDIEGGYYILCEDNVTVNIVGNLIVIAGLKLFGNNYYGLRIPYVFINFISLTLSGIILLRLRFLYGKKNQLELLLIALALIPFTIGFNYIMSGRVVEPTALRALFIEASIIVMLFVGKTFWRFWGIGFLVTVSVFLVYYSNLFLYLAVMLVLIITAKWEGKDAMVVKASSLLLGSIVGLCLAEGYYHYFWHEGAIAHMISTITSFSGYTDYQLGGGLYNAIKNLIRFLSANGILYSIPLAFIFYTCLPGVCAYCWNYRDERIFYMISLFVSFALQTMVSYDYVFRKFETVFPLLVYLPFVYYLLRKKINRISSYCNWRNYNIYRGYYFLGIYCLGVCFYRLLLIKDGTIHDFSFIDKMVLFSSSIVCEIILLLKAQRDMTKEKESYGLLFFTYLIVNTYFFCNYVTFNPTYSERDIMISLREFNGKHIMGYGERFGLYNNIQYITNTYDKYSDYISENEDVLFLDYSPDYDGSIRSYLDNIVFANSIYTVVPVENYERTFQAFGICRPITVYRRIEKAKVREYYHELDMKYSNVIDKIEDDFVERMELQGRSDEIFTEDYIKTAELPPWDEKIVRVGGFKYYKNLDKSILGKFLLNGVRERRLKEIERWYSRKDYYRKWWF